MSVHAFAERAARAAAAPAAAVLLQAAAVSRRAALSAAGTVARGMPTERGSGVRNLRSARAVVYLQVSKL